MFAAADMPAARATKRPPVATGPGQRWSRTSLVAPHDWQRSSPLPRYPFRASVASARLLLQPRRGVAARTASTRRGRPLQLRWHITDRPDARRRRDAPAASARSYGRGARINGDRRPVSPFVFGDPNVRYSIAGRGCHAARDCAATTVIRSITAWASRIWPTRHMSWVLP